jgi:hypothetical protein
MVALEGWAFSDERGTPVVLKNLRQRRIPDSSQLPSAFPVGSSGLRIDDGACSAQLSI